MPERAEDAPCIDAVMGKKALVLHGDERLFDVRGQFAALRRGTHGDLFAALIVEPHAGGGRGEFVRVQADVRRHPEIV